MSISDELAAEEVTADFVGDMAYDEQTFDKYVESNKENTGLLASIARIFRSIADFFRNIGDKAHAKRLDNMTKKLDALIAASSEAVANGAQSEAVRYSISATELAEIEAERKSIIKEAKANGTYLKAPNGQPTNLTPKQWVEVRTKRFKAWFGDWELAEIAEYLMSDDVVAILSGEEFTKDGTPLTKKVSEFYEENFNGKVMRKGLGEVILDKRSVKDSTIHGFGKAKTAAFAAVPNIITEGRIIDEQKNWKGRNYDSVTIAAPIRIGGSNYVGIVIVRKGQGTNSNRFYLHEVVLQENLQDESFKTDTKADSHRGDIAKVMQKIFISKVNTSKIVDANGEPKVVYHRTPNKFTTFDVDKIGSSSDFGAFGRGFYFSPFKEQYRLYGKYLIPAFLNVRNPFNLNSENLYDTKMSFGMSPEGIQRGWTRKVSEEFTQWLKDNGYDGVVYKTDYNEEEDVVFNPNQIKSATENVGTYDANNPDIRYSLREPIFYSNAEYAVRGIKQEKATPEQWLKMIEKNGGLKAGEDKWLGLSDWLKASDNKTLTKDEVLQYIAENDIQIEEVEYAQFGPGLIDEATRKLEAEMREIGIDAMRESVMQGQPKFSLRSDVADILNDYDNDGVKYGSMLDVADGIEGLIAESTEDTTELENILNDFRAAQDDARRWGNRMDSGGEDEFEEALRAYASQNEPKVSLRGSAQSLVGLHNISLDKLRKAIKMGGLANPSVAVIDVDKQTHDDYGEYSLILPKNMVDARQGKNAGTWAGDAWTPTYPQVVRRMTDDKAISRFYKDIDALPEAIRSRVHLDFDSFMEGRSANALAYWYLFEEGNAPALVYIPSRYSEDITNTVEEATNGSFSMYGLTPEERAKCLDAYIAVKFNGDRSAFEEEMQARIDRLTETIETKKSDRVKKWAQDTIDSIKEYGFDYDDVAKFISDVGYDAREKGKVNVNATITAAREQIETNNLNSGYDAWRDNLDERYGIEEYIFDGYTNSGNRRYLPHTVENAFKWMKKQGRQGAVATFPSFGTLVAVSIPKMTTLESIRKRKALLGKSKEEYDAFREKWENVYYELGKKLQPDAKSFDDYGYWRLIEAVENKNPREFIKKQYGIELSEKDMAQLNEMLDAIRTEYPARYFETKFERPLQLSDFVAAVVPNDIPFDVESRLRDANVEIFEYEKGDSSSRAEAMQKASAVDNVRFSLQTFDAVTNYITFEARAFGITTPIFVVENAEEFKQALREIGVRNVDDYENTAGIYDPDNDVIYIRADISEYERIFFETLLHENTHAVTRSILPNLEAVLSTLNEEDILAYRNSEMSSIYKNDSALSVLNEIISYFVEEIPHDKLIDYYQGEIDIEDNILSDFKISLIENELKRKFIAALRPVILENLEIQKRNYNERKGKAIVIARGYMGPYGAKDEKSKSGSVNTEHEGGYDARGEGKAQGGVLQKVGAQENQSVTPPRYSVRKDDMPFFYDEGGDVIIFDDLEDAPAEYTY